LASDLDQGLEWRRSSRCNGGTCVEAAVQGDAVVVRNSAEPAGPALLFSPAAWRDWVADVKQAASTIPAG